MKHALTLMLCLLTSPALALSCLPPDAVSLYEMARDSEERFVIVKGRVTPRGEVAIPKGKNGGGDAEATSPARMTGTSLTQDGFTAAFDRPVDLRVMCMGPWCAGAPSSDEIIAAVRLDGNDLVLDLDACFSSTVEATPEAAARLVTCHQGGACETAY